MPKGELDMIAARILAVSLLVLGIQAAQAATTTLTSFGDGSVRFISDGTSNTIQLGETSSAVACFKNVSQPASITDGTSNTLLLSEILGASFTAGHIYGYNNILPFFGDGSVRTVFPGGALDSYSYCLTEVDLLDPVEVTDGTSNTIRIGEDGFFGICFSNVRLNQVTDGTSNTILVGENDPNACFQNVGIDPNVTGGSVPGPGLLAVLALGLLGLGGAARRHRGRPVEG